MVRYPYLVVPIEPDHAEVIAADLWEMGAIGIEEQDSATLEQRCAGTCLVVHFATEAQARSAQRQLAPHTESSLHFIEGDDWRDAWKAFFKPHKIGKRLVIRPSWENYAADASELVITIDPGRAFGSGLHASTRLLLLVLDGTIRGQERVLDVGCGSGILAIAALLLGANNAVGIDIDTDALRVAQENASVNHVQDRLTLASLWPDAARYDVVLANIEAGVHLTLRDRLVSAVDSGGVLMLSGLLQEQEEDIVKAFAQARMRLRDRLSDGEWLALVLSHE